ICVICGYQEWRDGSQEELTKVESAESREEDLKIQSTQEVARVKQGDALDVLLRGEECEAAFTATHRNDRALFRRAEGLWAERLLGRAEKRTRQDSLSHRVAQPDEERC